MSYKMHILVCGGTGCRASASHQIITRLEECLKEKNLEDEVQVIATGCFGFCEKGPIVKVMPDNTFYVQVKPDDAEEIVNEHVIKGRKVERLLYKDPEKKEAVSDSKHMGFYKKQLRLQVYWQIAVHLQKKPGPKKRSTVQQQRHNTQENLLQFHLFPTI